MDVTLQLQCVQMGPKRKGKAPNGGNVAGGLRSGNSGKGSQQVSQSSIQNSLPVEELERLHGTQEIPLVEGSDVIQ